MRTERISVNWSCNRGVRFRSSKSPVVFLLTVPGRLLCFSSSVSAFMDSFGWVSELSLFVPHLSFF